MTRHVTISTNAEKKKVSVRPSEVLPIWRVSGRIRDCHRMLNTELQRRFNPFDITISDWLHLRNIAESEGLTQVELSRQLRMEKASSTAVLHKLRTLALIAGKRMKSDRRKIGIYLTPKGRRLMEKLIPNVLAVIERATTGVPDASDSTSEMPSASCTEGSKDSVADR